MKTQKIVSGLFVMLCMGPACQTPGSDSKKEMPSNAREEKSADSNSKPALVIQLQTDKKAYRRKDEIHFQITYLNQGEKPLRFLMDNTFVGDNFQCTSQAGEEIEANSGHIRLLLKAGLFPGRPHLLQPGEKKVFDVDALVDHCYDLVFSNKFKCCGNKNQVRSFV